MLTFAHTFPDTKEYPEGCAVAVFLWSVKEKAFHSQNQAETFTSRWYPKQKRFGEPLSALEIVDSRGSGVRGS